MEAEDIAQDAFVRAYLSLKDFRGESRFSTWLCRIALNRCKDLVRRRRREPWIQATRDGASQIPEVVDDGETPVLSLERREREAVLHRALARLPVKYREAVVLRHIEGLDFREIGRLLSIAEGAAKVRTFRGREMHLAKELSPEEKREFAALLAHDEYRRLFDAHQRMAVLLAGVPRHALSPSFTEEVLSRLPERRSRRWEKLWTLLWAPRIVRWNLASALSLSLLLGVTPMIWRTLGSWTAATPEPRLVVTLFRFSPKFPLTVNASQRTGGH